MNMPAVFKSLFTTHYKISQFKQIEIQLMCDTTVILKFSFDWKRAVDHAGFEFSIGICFLELILNFQDCRHWDYNANRWLSNEINS